jgi:excisionase family DNA binding protein
MPDQLRTIDEAAQRLRLKSRTVRRWVFLRKINYVKVVSSVRIPESEICRIIDEGTILRISEWRVVASDDGWRQEAVG